MNLYVPHWEHRSPLTIKLASLLFTYDGHIPSRGSQQGLADNKSFLSHPSLKENSNA
jgi:hypothetical protein